MMQHLLRTKHCRSAGFSLIEVLVALVILGVGLMGLARLQLYLLATTADTAAYDHAIRLANDQLEALRFTRLSGGVRTSGADEPTAQGLVFHRTWSVSCAAGQSCSAQVLLRWREPRAAAESPEREIVLAADLAPPSAAAQGWLVQSGPPRRETLP